MSPNKENNWKDLKRPLVPIIAHMVRSKALAPHDIIQIKMGAAPIIIEAFQSATCIQRL